MLPGQRGVQGVSPCVSRRIAESPPRAAALLGFQIPRRGRFSKRILWVRLHLWGVWRPGRPVPYPMDDNPATLPDQHCSKAGKGPKTKRFLKSAKIALVRFDERDDPGFLDWVRSFSTSTGTRTEFVQLYKTLRRCAVNCRCKL
jgi:hypothetical protein